MRAKRNSEGFRETLSEERQKEPRRAKMAGRREAAEGARSPCDLGSKIGGGKTESCLEMTGDLAPVYQEGGGQGRKGLSRSERDMEFVRETMLTAQMQSIITRIEMVAQDLIQTASGDDAQQLKRSMRAFKSALAWGMELLDHIGRHCKWPPTVKSEVASRVNEITKVPLGSQRRKDADVTHFLGSGVRCSCGMGKRAHRDDAP